MSVISVSPTRHVLGQGGLPMVPVGDTFARTGAVQFDFPPDVVFRALTEALPQANGFEGIG
jgi:hypothetical protein